MSTDLTLRCLNALRKQHLPSYMAMRFMANSIVSSNESSFSRKSILRRYKAHPALDYL
jgi:hypothetical protein